MDGGDGQPNRQTGMRYRNGAPNRQPQPNDMRRSTTDGRNDQLRHWLADGNLDVAVADFTGMPTGVELVNFYQERMVLVIANSL